MLTTFPHSLIYSTSLKLPSLKIAACRNFPAHSLATRTRSETKRRCVVQLWKFNSGGIKQRSGGWYGGCGNSCWNRDSNPADSLHEQFQNWTKADKTVISVMAEMAFLSPWKQMRVSKPWLSWYDLKQSNNTHAEYFPCSTLLLLFAQNWRYLQLPSIAADWTEHLKILPIHALTFIAGLAWFIFIIGIVTNSIARHCGIESTKDCVPYSAGQVFMLCFL